MNYTPHSDEDVAEALRRIGASSVEELFDQVPSELLDPPIELPSGLHEAALLDEMRGLARTNRAPSSLLGGGLGRHFIPSVARQLAAQSEFVTAYTPYQPEVSQGILQATFEFQTMMSELTGLPVSNASMYDGASAVAEAALLAVRHTGRSRVVVSAGVHPQTREVLNTYLPPLDIELETLPLEGLVSPTPELDDSTAALIVQQPNFLGYLEGTDTLAGVAREVGALFVSVVDPLSLAVLKPPGEYGAHIAVGDGQTLGNPLSFGGPHFGFMVVAEELLRQLPGRLVGETRDVDGRRGFVLTLQAREQHIRRARAKSNICSNHQLTALLATVTMAALGPSGLRDLAVGSVANAHALADELAGAGYRVRDESRFFSEFVVELPRSAAAVRRELARAGIEAGIPLQPEYGSDLSLLVGATELSDAAERGRLLTAMREIAPAPGAEVES